MSRAGEIVGVIGPNGAGKTTLFDCLSGFLPGRGTVSIGGRDVTRLGAAPARRRRTRTQLPGRAAVHHR